MSILSVFQDSTTALIAASDTGDAEIVDLLIKAGADVEAKTDVSIRINYVV